MRCTKLPLVSLAINAMLVMILAPSDFLGRQGMDITNTSNVLGKDNPWIAPVDETKFAGEVAAVEHVAREVAGGETVIK